MLLSEIRDIKSDAKTLRSFGLTVGGVFLAIGAFSFWRGNPHAAWFLAPGGALFVLGAALPRVLRPVQKAWMTLALLMGFVMTRVLLAVLFFFVLTPIGWIARLSGKDFMSVKGKPSSYWTARPKRDDPAYYEQQY